MMDGRMSKSRKTTREADRELLSESVLEVCEVEQYYACYLKRNNLQNLRKAKFALQLIIALRKQLGKNFVVPVDMTLAAASTSQSGSVL